MPDQTIDNAVADAALESVAAEVQTKRAKSGSSTADQKVDQKVADLEQQVREANDRALRSHAELENFRKRSQRELADERRYAIIPFARDLLAVIDNLERAIEAGTRDSGLGTKGGSSEASPPSPEPRAPNPLLDGVKMVADQLENVLKAHQCVRIETVGTPFDPNFHQALAQEPSNDHPAGTITRATQAGYKLHDRVIRPAQVFVSTGPAT
jgi:molecular chaperone GrpE